MTKKILIINGPNLNLLGEREETKYGKATLEQVKKNCETHAESIDLKIKFEQSNIEGEIVTMIQKAKDSFDAIIINAAGYTHTSVSILDALLAIKIPTIEIHITNIYNREEFRKKSLISKAAQGIICGFGVNGYIMALDAIKKILNKNEN
jgi:3-dehydroquinate dehydratase II